MTKTVLLIDLDTPIFAASAVSEQRSVIVTHIPTGKQKIFKTRTEFKDSMKAKNKEINQADYSFEDKQEPEAIENACHTLKMMIKGIEEEVQADEVLYFVSGKDNFRDKLELPIKYKSSRSNVLRPLLLKDVRQFAINKFKPEVCDFEEADDRIIYRAYDEIQKGNKAIVVTIDKDAKAYCGIYIFNQDHRELGVNEIPQLGSLIVDEKNKVRGDGFLWYAFQHLNGDMTDCYKPTDLCKVKFGEKSAYKLLKDCKSEKEALEVVIKQFKTWYPEAVTYTDWSGKEHTKDHIQIADLYFKCCRMKSNEFDDLDFVEFCKQYGVTP
jgi:hypothetical protein